MLKDIFEVAVRPPPELFIRFEDGAYGEFDVETASSIGGVG